MKFYPEVFDSPYPYDWYSTPSEMQARFVTDDGKRGVVGITKRYGVGASAAFMIDHDTEITGGGDAFRVMATVVEVLEDYLRRNRDLEFLEFSATTRSPTRIKLYDRMLDKLARKYRVDVETTGSEKIWTINLEGSPKPILSIDEYHEMRRQKARTKT